VTAVAQTCIGQPLSWLVLERHALAELEGAAARAADEHLAECAACSHALRTIKGDTRALPALPTVRPERSPGERPDESKDGVRPFDSAAPRRRSARTGMIAAGVFLAAAAALLLVIIRPTPTEPTLTARVRVKGAGVVVMTLVRERDGNVTFDPRDVRDTDRWKVQLTCAPGGGARTEIVVYQPGQPPAVALPAQSFTCGNNIVIPGAFRITGGAAIICARLAADPLGPLPPTPNAQMACAQLDTADH
jgi:hypothetical protein